MLDKELDKLRDKTLSFGCVILNDAKLEERYDGSQGKNHIYEVIGHPLTRGRIEYLHHTKNNDTDEYWSIHELFLFNPELYNQSELKRMEHEKRQELKELLIQFSNYL